MASPVFANTCTKLSNATESQLETLIIGMGATGQDVCGTPLESQGEGYVEPELSACSLAQKRVYVDSKLWGLVMNKYRRGEKIQHRNTLTEASFDPAG